MVGVSTKEAPVHCSGYIPLLGIDKHSWDLVAQILWSRGGETAPLHTVISQCKLYFLFLFDNFYYYLYINEHSEFFFLIGGY